MDKTASEKVSNPKSSGNSAKTKENSDRMKDFDEFELEPCVDNIGDLNESSESKSKELSVSGPSSTSTDEEKNQK